MICRFQRLAHALHKSGRTLLLMKSNIIKKTAKGLGLGIFMAFGIMAFSSTEANAQYRNPNNQQDRRDNQQDRRDDRNDRNRNDLYSVARENGFRDGQNEAQNNRRDRNHNDAQKSNEYKKATHGYSSRLGSKNDYKNAYRQAFMEGYNSGNNRNGRDGNHRNGN